MSVIGAGTRPRWLLAVTTSMAVWAAAACFSERTSGLPGGGDCQIPVTVVDSQHVLVAIRTYAFLPDSIRIPAGTTVTWLNCEDPTAEAHTTTSNTSLWNSNSFTTGQRFSHTFAAAGVFPYFCAFHASMTGRVVVQ